MCRRINQRFLKGCIIKILRFARDDRVMQCVILSGAKDLFCSSHLFSRVNSDLSGRRLVSKRLPLGGEAVNRRLTDEVSTATTRSSVSIESQGKGTFLSPFQQTNDTRRGHLIRPGLAAGPPSPQGEGFWAHSISTNQNYYATDQLIHQYLRNAQYPL